MKVTIRPSSDLENITGFKTLVLGVCLQSLSSYHRRLRMITEALELRVEGGRVSHSLCMCAVGYGYCGLGGGRDGSGEWQASGTKPGG